MNKSESIKELAAALAKAQAEIGNAVKNSDNSHFRSRYADLAEVLNTVRPVFAQHGLSFMQFPGFESGIVSVETVIAHSSGEWISSTLHAPVSKHDAQGVGSALTYARRYSLAACAGIAQEDDDGEAAVGRPVTNRPIRADQHDGGRQVADKKPVKVEQRDGGHQVGDEPIEAQMTAKEYEDEHLQKLRDAAMAGKESLQLVFESLPASDNKKKLWAKHGDALKAAAKQVEA
jgi:hypothetical protein